MGYPIYKWKNEKMTYVLHTRLTYPVFEFECIYRLYMNDVLCLNLTIYYSEYCATLLIAQLIYNTIVKVFYTLLSIKINQSIKNPIMLLYCSYMGCGI